MARRIEPTRNVILRMMEWDLPYHLQEIVEITDSPYGNVGRVLDTLVKEGIITRYEYTSAVYIKHSPLGKLKHDAKMAASEIKYKQKHIQKLKDELQKEIEEFNKMKEKIKEIEIK